MPKVLYHSSSISLQVLSPPLTLHICSITYPIYIYYSSVKPRHKDGVMIKDRNLQV